MKGIVISKVVRRLRRFLLRKIHFGLFKPGHFYHPVPGKDEILTFAENEELFGIDLDADSQIELVKEISKYRDDFRFPAEKDEIYRLYLNNSLYNRTDSLVLFLMIRSFKPNKIIEVGSGFSSALMLDTNDYFEENKIDLTFIEPNPTRLKALLKKNEKPDIIEKKIQDVPLPLFEDLNANDFLFIDSSHVSKYGSDVNHLLFHVLPRLKAGVIVHFHDICYPFEYPKDWLKRGIYWNEAYLLRAFLSYNFHFKIMIFNHFLGSKHQDVVKRILPGFEIGGSLWLMKRT